MESKKASTAKLETRFRRWGAKLDTLTAKAGDARTEIKADYRKRLSDLRMKYDAAHKKLVEFNTASGGKWDIFKIDMDIIWKDIGVTYKGLTH